MLNIEDLEDEFNHISLEIEDLFDLLADNIEMSAQRLNKEDVREQIDNLLDKKLELQIQLDELLQSNVEKEDDEDVTDEDDEYEFFDVTDENGEEWF